MEGKNKLNKFLISVSPHVQDHDSIRRIMISVILALLPAGIFSVYLFGLHALYVILLSIASAVLTEWACLKVMKRPLTLDDGSAVLTGLLLAYNVPAEVPLWLPVVGSAAGILLGKMVFGGIGYNPMNPAIIGRAFLMASWPVHMTIFRTPPGAGTISGIEAVTQATPLQVFKASRLIVLNASQHGTDQVTQSTLSISQLYSSLEKLFFGYRGGCIGETSVLLLLIGALFLISKRIIGWKIPFSYLGTVAVLSWIFAGTDGRMFSGNPLFHMFSGGLILGAFYMATDMVTTPVTYKGRLLFGMGCGAITMIIRLWGGYPEGVSYAILLMNLTTPLLDRVTQPRVFGGR